MGGHSWRRWLTGAILFWALGAPQARAADRPAEKARAHFELGERLFKVSRYRDALEEFKEAYIVKADPAFLFNIAQCHRLLGERADAITFYRRYLATVPDARNRPEVERRLRELEAAVTSERQADSEAAPTSPPPLGMAPPVPARAEAPPAPRLPAAPEAAVVGGSPPPVEGESPVYGRWWFWAGAAAVVAAGVGAVVLVQRGQRQPGGCGAGQFDSCVERF